MLFIQAICFTLLFVASQCGPWMCPDPNSFDRVCVQYHDQCQSNADCGGGEKCCLVAGCGKECMRLKPRGRRGAWRSGCPKIRPYTQEECATLTLLSNCKIDTDCPAQEQCCAGPCGVLQCQPIRPNICKLRPDVGSCDGVYEMYYWNGQTKSCETFVYGGCDGNSNKFETLEECQRACGPICGPVCLIFCPFGNVLDKDGCPTCLCKTGCRNNAASVPNVSCQKDGNQCPDGTTCVVPDTSSTGVCCANI